MFNIRDRVIVYAGEYTDKVGTIITINYPPKGEGVPIVILRLDDNTEINVSILDL